MKLSGTAVLALLATSATAIDWTCNNRGGGGHDTLKRLHGQFNRLFGTPNLNIASQQCYLVKCYDHYFGVCNHAGYTQFERSGDRNAAANANPEGGSACGITPSPVNEPYLSYLYTRVNHISLGPKTDVRSC
ncbi:hypothetical protein EMCG_00468 [[Emmonsia] crescens]|uniref:Killer toxin Kp4 domain-containing protein n=1 Tax=[Emmonsia] crescens TaxID=73230 RepID=A0A0G2HVQ8_9EURO|nr:hypothetical protein EMCG_00468 [Emmonsia crescens UAMH 3008]